MRYSHFCCKEGINLFINKLINQKGFTIVEVLVAMTILLINVTAFMMLYTYVAQANYSNKARFVATNLASGIMEEIRESDYMSELGEVSGTPVGTFPAIQTRTLNGIEYTINTEIIYDDDPSDGTNSSDSLPLDYKGIRVTVSAPNAFTGQVVQYADIKSLASKEGGEAIVPILCVQVNRGWVTTPGVTVPVEDVDNTLMTGPGAPRYQTTDANGKSIYDISLSSGVTSATATVNVTPPSGMIVRPDLADEQSVTVTNGTPVTAVFDIEYPCILNVVNISGTVKHIVLKQPYGDEIAQEQDLQIDESIDIPNLWPVGVGYARAYELLVEVDLVPYNENFSDDDDGFFTTPNGSNGSWAYGTPTSGPGSAHTGSNVWATNLSGNYLKKKTYDLRSPVRDISSLKGDSFTLSWFQWLKTNGNQIAHVDVSKDGGSTWNQDVQTPQDNIDGWQQKSVTLDKSYAVNNFQVRFRLVTGNNNTTYPGWYIDDISISGQGYQESSWDGKFDTFDGTHTITKRVDIQ